MTENQQLDALIDRFAAVPASERINLRDPILEFGNDCIEPLVRLVESTPDLGASVASWLEALATHQPSTLPAVRMGLGRIATTTGGDMIEAAKQGSTVVYSELETSRGHIGKYLIEISREEAAASRPPLTSIVVSKSTGLPGDGYIPAMVEVGFAEPHEGLRDVWQRAKAAVFAYWRDGIRA